MSESKDKWTDKWEGEFPITKVEKKDFGKFNLLKRFLEIPDCPEQIYYRGNFPGEHFHFLAVVGSRNISNYGKDCVKELLSGLRGQNICIISGLALGTDGESHLAALENNLPTIGIPGSSIEEKEIGPKTNKEIAENILKSGGLLLSEFDSTVPVGVWSFPARNRLMAALADCVLVIEAGEKSGSLITARLAVEYNKDVLCVPGQINSTNSKGTNNLIANGARLVQNSSDILHQFRIALSNDGQVGRDIPEQENFSDLEKIVLVSLKEPVSKDFLLQKLTDEVQCDISEFLMAMTMLEMKGYLKEEVGVVRRVR
jgi:DNA processing protein